MQLSHAAPGVLHQYIHIEFADRGVTGQKLVVRLSKSIKNLTNENRSKTYEKCSIKVTHFGSVVVNESSPEFLTKTGRMV